LGKNLIIASVRAFGSGQAAPGTGSYAAALKASLEDKGLDGAFRALMLGLPTEADIVAALGVDVDTDLIFKSREHVRRELGIALKNVLLGIWKETRETGSYQPTPEATGRRALRYAALGLLAAGTPDASIGLIQDELSVASNMTAEIGALTAMLGIDTPETLVELNNFYTRHGGDHLLIDKWFALNSCIPGPGAAARIEALMSHPEFRLTTPNRVYALIGGFTSMNLSGFHAADGEGYRIVAETILNLDAINPQVAARLATGFRSWGMMNEARRAHATEQLQRIVNTANLSRDCFEIVSRTLKG
jgi:aminopeptidase N